MTRDERMARGRSAEWLLNQDIFAECMETCLRLIQTRWANSKPDDPASREVLFHQFTAVHDIEEMLRNFSEDGTRAENEKDGD